MIQLAQKDALVEDMKYSSALNNRTIYLSEDVDDDICFKVNYFLDRIVRLDDEDGTKNPVSLNISSFGGSAYEILSVISRVERMKESGYIIKTFVDAKAMSAGSFLAQCGTKGYRTANRYATILYHQVSSMAMGTISDLDTNVDEAKRLWDLFITITVKNTNMTKEYMEDIKYRNRDVYLTPEQALELGVIDKII